MCLLELVFRVLLVSLVWLNTIHTAMHSVRAITQQTKGLQSTHDDKGAEESRAQGFLVFKRLSTEVSFLPRVLLVIIAEYYGPGPHAYRILPILNPYDKSYTRSGGMPRAYLIEVQETKNPADGSVMAVPAIYPVRFLEPNWVAHHTLPSHWNGKEIARYIRTEKVIPSVQQDSLLVREYDSFGDGIDGVVRRVLCGISDMMACQLVPADSVIAQRGTQQSALILVDTTFAQFFRAWKNQSASQPLCIEGTDSVKRHHDTIVKEFPRYEKVFETLIHDTTGRYVPVFFPRHCSMSIEKYSAIQPTPWQPPQPLHHMLSDLE